MSKADLLDSADLDRVRTYVAGQIRKKLGTDVAVRPISTVPSHESLLREWIRDEVARLGGQAQGRAREALRRKADVLRQQAITALERYTKGSGHSHSPEVASSVVTQVRDMGARLERTSRELLLLHDRKAAMVDAALDAAAQAFADGEGAAHTGDEALRADLVRSSQEVDSIWKRGQPQPNRGQGGAGNPEWFSDGQSQDHGKGHAPPDEPFRATPAFENAKSGITTKAENP